MKIFNLKNLYFFLKYWILEGAYAHSGDAYAPYAAHMLIHRLNVQIEQVEEDLLAEKMKIKKISDGLNQSFDDMLNQ